MDDSGSSDSWNKLVIANNSNEWSPNPNIKTERIDDTDEAVSTTGFCLDYDPLGSDNADSATTSNDYSKPYMSEQDYLAENKKIIQEEPGHRAQRLAKMSAYAAQRLANESPEQRAVRLRRMSEYAAKRLANETSEQRAKRLSRMSAYAARRLAKETPEQRQERLTRMSAYAARRHAMKKMNAPDTDTGKRRKSSKNSVIISADKSNANDTPS